AQSKVLHSLCEAEGKSEAEIRRYIRDDNTFVEWRYFYEVGDVPSTRPKMLINFARSLESILIARHPDWKNRAAARYAAGGPPALPANWDWAQPQSASVAPRSVRHQHLEVEAMPR